MSNTNYGIIGSGFMAKHMSNYFSLLGQDFVQWHRGMSDISVLKHVKTVLVLISDDNIEGFVQDNSFLMEKTLVHFSGALEVKGIISFHPLMTFGEHLYTLEHYKSIPFVGTSSSQIFHKIFPMLKNPYFRISPKEKPYYHSLCVIGGNFTTILWQKVIRDFEKQLSIPREALIPYMETIFNNLKANPKTALTGPIKRQDKKTITKNIKALDKLWGKIYALFNKAYLRGLK